MGYQAPVDDIVFALKTAAGVGGAPQSGSIDEGADEETIRAILEEAGRFASEVLAPLNATGDRQGAVFSDGEVATPAGWRDAYLQFREAGWSGLPCPDAFGGQDLPQVVAMGACEIWNAANLAFGVCPLLTQGAIDALSIGADDQLKARYLPKLVTGEWSGTMNLTEPQAGSDLGAVATRAERRDDGTYRIFGTKIYISYGEHDLTTNVIHLVLARLSDAPDGTKGISLFLVPKFLLDENGEPGLRNDVACAGIEHKMGIHASPTCVMTYGEKVGAVGYLVGEENRGLNTMFVMMNAARLAVGMQGVAIAERASQHALAYARERVQGGCAVKAMSGEDASQKVAIVSHPDVQRMLMRMQALTQAARAICLVTARQTDIAHRSGDERECAKAGALVALLTPVAKAFATDAACEVASLGVQVHGGMGFVEDAGAAQFYRDARILPIYEGTNGIQAIDLIHRKLPLGDGEVMQGMLEDFEATVAEVGKNNVTEFGAMGERLALAVDALKASSRWMSEVVDQRPEAALSGATTFLRLFGLTAGGVYLARGALAAQQEAGGAGLAMPGLRHVALARYFAEHVCVEAPGLAQSVMSGSEAVMMLGPDQLSQ